MTTILSPAAKLTLSRALSAVAAPIGTAAASTNETLSGLSDTSSSATLSSSANAPATVLAFCANTASPTFTRVTALPTAVTTPLRSWPGTCAA